jgi:hypothetical protein
MTARELIAALQDVPAETLIYTWSVDGGRAPVVSVDNFALQEHGFLDINTGPE